MKQILILMIALSISICVTAQNREISGYILKDLTDIVKIEGNNVNLRKAPSASSPRLVSQVYDTDEIADVLGKWSDEVSVSAMTHWAAFKEVVPLQHEREYRTSGRI